MLNNKRISGCCSFVGGVVRQQLGFPGTRVVRQEVLADVEVACHLRSQQGEPVDVVRGRQSRG